MNEATGKPEGFGGWLLVVAIGQWLGLLRALVDFTWDVPTWAGQWSDPLLRRAAIGEAGLSLGLLAFMLYTAIVMSMKRRDFPTLFRIELALFVLVPLLSTWWVSRSTGTAVDKASFAVIATEAVLGTIGASISILYSLRSARVRNTFVY
ncbi:MAG: DUF2569 family protein [Reyranellales bacterium]